MKLSKSKLALAKVINENGGWVDGANFSSQDCDGWVYHFTTKPTIDSGSEVWKHKGCIGKGHFKAGKIKNWHQTILSREEYYQAYLKADADGWVEWNGVAKSPVGKGVAVDVKMKNGTQHFGQLIDDECWGDHWGDASIIAYRPHKPGVKPEFCESVMRSIPEPEAKQTIEQLAHDYRNKIDYANSKRQEADDSKAAADAALGELKRAGEALGLLIGIAKHEHELVITDWRDLRVGDEVECTKYDSEHRFGVVCRIDASSEEQPIMVDHGDGRGVSWPSCWKFIRRP